MAVATARLGSKFKVMDHSDPSGRYGHVGEVTRFSRGVMVLKFQDGSLGSYPQAHLRDATPLQRAQEDKPIGRVIAERQRQRRRRKKRAKIIE